MHNFVWPCGAVSGADRFGPCPLDPGHAPPCRHPDRAGPLLSPLVPTPEIECDDDWLAA